ncbi:hypothetical protein [Paenibacillus sp. Aloe-11]|uniref:hypothetical protein n=1 Tax=Paenibacillus sp. Aloe-11 TaxID=1050222 RepID=UPI00024EFF9C|nr:hypothetical protein [Paenibacillus sp. Aloe-11]EHS59439.1 hypothetical protein WG8_0654 [Paenibacillus sp. Aloe-11]
MDKIQKIRKAHEATKRSLAEGRNIAFTAKAVIEPIEYLLQQIEIKDKALEFYADQDNYDEYDLGLVDVDRGNRARAALKGEDTP